MAHLESIDKDVAARRGERPTDFSAPAIPAHFESNTSLAAVAETPTKVLSTEEKYDTLVQLLTRPDLKVLNGLNNLVPDEEKTELRNSVTRIFEQTKSFVPFLAGVLEAETVRADVGACVPQRFCGRLPPRLLNRLVLCSYLPCRAATRRGAADAVRGRRAGLGGALDL